MLRFTIVLFFNFLLFFSSVAQKAIEKKYFPLGEEKLGLVLSGGGARGVAHITLLKAIDSLGIKVDYITGTSMGAVVGGLYAIGYSGKEIEQIALETDWDMLLSDNIPFKSVSIREKEDFYKYILSLPIDKGGIHLPKGLIEGQGLSSKLSELTAPAYKIRDFSKFPIPFKCIATDLETGKVVALDSGNLAEAIRASMSIPSVFSPIKRNGKLLADGGMVRNLPVTEVREMGATVVVGSNVATADYSVKGLDTFVKILLQCSSFVNNRGLEKQKDSCDYYIDFAPNLSIDEISSSSFDKVKTILVSSRKSVQEYQSELGKLKNRLANGKELLPVRSEKYLDPVDSLDLLTVKLIGFKGFSQRFVYKNSGIESGKKISIQEIEGKVEKLYGTGFFEQIKFWLEPASDNRTVLVLEAQQKPKGLLNFSPHYNNEDKIALNLNLTLRNKLGKNTKFSNSFYLSENPILDFHLTKYRGKQLMFSENGRIRFENTLIPLDDFEHRSFKNMQMNYLSLGSYTSFMGNTYYQLGLGSEFNFNWNQINLFNSDSIGDRRYINIDNQNFKLNFFWKINNQDAFIFPSKGIKLDVDFSHYWLLSEHKSTTNVADDPIDLYNKFKSTNYFRLRLDISRYYKLSKSLSLFWEGGLGYTLSGSNGLAPFWIGSPNQVRQNQVSFYGLAAYGASAQQYTKLGLGFQYSPVEKFYIIPRLNALLQAEKFDTLYALDNLKSNSGYSAYGLSLAYASFLGPLNITFMQSTPKKEFIVYFNLGFSF